jgi:voltage-gated potassium channel
MVKIGLSNKGLLSSSLQIAIILVILLILTGFVVYHWYFDFSVIDAFYMTIITIGTVGFGEVEPLTDGGKLFTSFLILLSVFIFAYAVTTISANLVAINSIFNFNQKKMENTISTFKGHVIICGYGRNGKQAAKKLKSYKQDFVIIEQSASTIKEVVDDGFLFIEGNATDDETLLKAGVVHASYLISTLPSDSDNVFITLSARQLNKKMLIVSRASEESSIKKLKIAGADNVIMPDKIGGDHMASLVVSPDLIEFLDNLAVSSSGAVNIQEIILSNMPEIKTIDELKIKEKTGCTVIGYKSKDGNYIINPEIQLPVGQEGRIIVLGNTGQIRKLNKVFNLS